jgi:Flp pilus assembly protein TadD
LDAKNADAWYFLGRAYYSMTRLHETETAFQEALDLRPRFGKAENNLGVVYEAENRSAGALRTYETAVA